MDTFGLRKVGLLLTVMAIIMLLATGAAFSAGKKGKKPSVSALEMEQSQQGIIHPFAPITPSDRKLRNLTPSQQGIPAWTGEKARSVEAGQFSPASITRVKKVRIPNFVRKAGDPRKLSNFNPIIKSGRALYDATCAACHGVRGDGKGPEADGFMTPMRVANFMESDDLVRGGYAYAYKRLNEGGRGETGRRAYRFSAMPSWRDHFTETEKWQVILYLYKNAGIAPRKLPASR